MTKRLKDRHPAPPRPALASLMAVDHQLHHDPGRDRFIARTVAVAYRGARSMVCTLTTEHESLPRDGPLRAQLIAQRQAYHEEALARLAAEAFADEPVVGDPEAEAETRALVRRVVKASGLVPPPVEIK